MTVRRITIGLKPAANAMEAAEALPGETQNGATGMHQPAPGTIEEFVNGGHEPKAARPAADAWVKRGGETGNARSMASFGGMVPLVTAGAGAAIGAIVAAVAITMLLPRLSPPLDARLAPVADRVAAIEIRQQETEIGLGRLNNEVAQAIEADGAAATRIEEQAAAVADLEKLVADRAVDGPVAVEDAGLTVFAVAVGQLRDAFYDGRPFEAELVNVYALAGKEEALLPLLHELSAPARSGIGGSEALRRELAAAAAAAGLAPGEPQSYYDYGLSMVNQYIGYSGEPYSVEIAHVAVGDADRKLAVGDVAGAVELVKSLDPSIAPTFEPWLKSAGAYVRAETAVAELTKTAVDRLRLRMGADGAG
jgi:hypothetical protein